MAINTQNFVNNSSNLITQVKSFSRGGAFPIDRHEIWYKLEDVKGTKENGEEYVVELGAKGYASHAIEKNGEVEIDIEGAENAAAAYVGQTIKVIENGVLTVYVIADENGTLLKLIDTTTMNTALESKLNTTDVEAIPDSEILALFST